MAGSPLERVDAHWHKYVPMFSTSVQTFYDQVESALLRLNLRDLWTSRVERREGGMLSALREYLRIEGEHHVIDVCAAPYGTGFFFSSWLVKQEARWVALYWFGFAIAFFAVWAGLTAGAAVLGPIGLLLLGNPLILGPLSAIVVWWAVATLAQSGRYGPEAAMLRMPLIGWIYARLFSPATYYRIDTMLMFQTAVHSAVLGVIDAQFQEKGLRALTAGERKPIFRDLLLGGAESEGDRGAALPAVPESERVPKTTREQPSELATVHS